MPFDICSLIIKYQAMIGAIPNPKKTINIEFPIKKVKDSLPAIPALNSKYKSTSANDLLNLFTFEAFETLSLGVYIDISLKKESETATELTIEVRRKVGSFNQSHEVTNANNHIQNMLQLISSALSISDEGLEKIKVSELSKPKGGCMLVSVIITSVIGLLIYSSI